MLVCPRCETMYADGSYERCPHDGSLLYVLGSEGPTQRPWQEGDEIAEEADISIGIPKIDPILTPLLSVIPTQLLAYHTALARDCDVDRPRNLAKSVTVE